MSRFRALTAAFRRLLEGRNAADLLLAERKTALEKLFGPAVVATNRSSLPVQLDGQADVLAFAHHIVGATLFVTADLTGAESGQEANGARDQYELAICVRGEERWPAGTVSALAAYSMTHALGHGDTVRVVTGVPQPSSIAAFLLADYGSFALRGKRCGILLAFGITGDELQMCLEAGSTTMLEALRGTGVFPFTDPERETISGGAVRRVKSEEVRVKRPPRWSLLRQTAFIASDRISRCVK